MIYRKLNLDDNERLDEDKAVKEATENLAKHRFNYKVYELIAEASDTKTLLETELSYQSWF